MSVRPPVPDPVDLTRALIRCPSVTPADAGALALVAGVLEGAGFACRRVDRGGVPNLFARWGAPGHPRTFGFNGHTDVVPPGPAEAWTTDPFGGTLRDGQVWGRGAADMKSGVAAMVCAAARFVAETPPDGAVIVTVTGDEEAAGIDGTAAILDWMAAAGEAMAACLVGEPTSVDRFGDTVKIGRRGSLTARITAAGVQGHAAYPHRARNPLPVLVRFLDRVASHRLDAGTAHFDPSTLAITTVDTDNPAANVIPGSAQAVLNIRFNDAHDVASLTRWLEAEAAAAAAGTGVTLTVAASASGAAFLTPPGPLSDLVCGAVRAVAGVTPQLSTSGGTSDARFIRAHCPVVEFGLVGQTMHQTDERVEAAQIGQLTAVYGAVLRGFFA